MIGLQNPSPFTHFLFLFSFFFFLFYLSCLLILITQFAIFFPIITPFTTLFLVQKSFQKSPSLNCHQQSLSDDKIISLVTKRRWESGTWQTWRRATWHEMIGLTGQPFGWGRDQTGKGTVPLSDLLGLPGWQVVTWTSPCVVKKASSFGLRFPTDGDINHLFPIGSCYSRATQSVVSASLFILL